MTFKLGEYIEPDFSQKLFRKAPEARLTEAPKDMTAPEGFHATSIYPEYFKLDGRWILPKDSRMDCVAVYEDGDIHIREFRNIKKGDLVVLGRTEKCEDGIYVNENSFRFPDQDTDEQTTFSFRQGRSRETAFS